MNCKKRNDIKIQQKLKTGMYITVVATKKTRGAIARQQQSPLLGENKSNTNENPKHAHFKGLPGGLSVFAPPASPPTIDMKPKKEDGRDDRATLPSFCTASPVEAERRRTPLCDPTAPLAGRVSHSAHTLERLSTARAGLLSPSRHFINATFFVFIAPQVIDRIGIDCKLNFQVQLGPFDPILDE